MTRREDKERVKTSREELGKFFYRLAEISFTTMVVGVTISWVTHSIDAVSYCYVLLIGLAMTFCFAMLGNRILNKKII